VSQLHNESFWGRQVVTTALCAEDSEIPLPLTGSEKKQLRQLHREHNKQQRKKQWAKLRGVFSPGKCFGAPALVAESPNIPRETTDTLGTPLPISLKWLECSHKEMWDLK